MLFLTITRTIIDQVEINVSSACPKCGAGTWFVNTMEAKIYALFGSTTQVRAEVVCAECGKRIRKSLWPIEVVDLVAQKNKEFKPSFLKRFGFFIILLSLFIGIVSYAVIDAVLDHKELMDNAHSNFAKCYASKMKEEWYNGLEAGDFILANKQGDPARVFRIKSIDDKVVVLDAFKLHISRNDYQELETLNELKLGEGDFTEYRVKKKYFMRGILEEESESDMGGLNNMYIQQIKKK